MDSDCSSFLSSLQHADSFFPSGTVAMSGGLEALCDEGVVSSLDSLERFLFGQLRWRWATMDRVFVTQAAEVRTNLEVLSTIDRQFELQSLAKESREGSWRSGRALLQVHIKLGTPGVDGYQESDASEKFLLFEQQHLASRHETPEGPNQQILVRHDRSRSPMLPKPRAGHDHHTPGGTSPRAGPPS